VGYFALLERTEAAILLDYYGKLLTKRQREVMSAYYEDDLSLAEIAENLGISRPGVHDLLRRALTQLRYLEEQLGLAARDRRRREVIDRLKALTVKLADTDLPTEARSYLQELTAELAKLEQI